jgi:hypothetical protein
MKEEKERQNAKAELNADEKGKAGKRYPDSSTRQTNTRDLSPKRMIVRDASMILDS